MDFATLIVAFAARQSATHDFVLKFWPDEYEITLFPDGRAIIKGTRIPPSPAASTPLPGRVNQGVNRCA